MIAQAALQDTLTFTDFLSALAKEKVLSGSLEQYAAGASERKLRKSLEDQQQKQREAQAQRDQQRQQELRLLLHTALAGQLINPDSELVLLITAFLTEKDDFKELAPQTVASWFHEIISHSPDHLDDVQAPVPVTRQPHQLAGGERTITLKHIQGMPINGKHSRPVTLCTPDGQQILIHSWVDMAEQVVRWFLQQTSPLPIPFEGINRNRWFLNHAAIHKRPDQRKKFQQISVNGKTVYMDKDRSGQTFLHDIHALCLAMHIPPEGFQITL